MKEIKLTRGQVTLVDDEDFEYLNQFNFHAKPGQNTYYAICKIKANGKYLNKRLHRLIMNPPDNMEVDHIDRDGLNNQKSNLRICTHQQNQMNCLKQKNTTSKYKGVHFNGKNYHSYIKINQKRIHIGYYDREIDAAKAYDKKAKELYKEYSNINIK